MKKLNAMGIGPRIGIVSLPWFAGTIILSLLFRPVFNLTSGKNTILMVIGFVLLALGLIFYFSTAPSLLKGIKETRLMTSGTYRICQNPLYASMILLIIPSVALLLNSWLILTTSIIAYILFKLKINKEYTELEEFFGEKYIEYRSKTPEFFPFIRFHKK